MLYNFQAFLIVNINSEHPFERDFKEKWNKAPPLNLKGWLHIKVAQTHYP